MRGRQSWVWAFGGPLMGLPNVACRFLEMAMLHVSVAYFPQCQCHMSNLRNGYVRCHYILNPHVPCHYAPCHMSNLRNGHVALSILGVKGHLWGPPTARMGEGSPA